MSDKKTTGLAILEKMHPQAYPQLKASLEDICPEISDYITEFAYGTIYAREGTDLKTRSLATIAALTAMNTAEGELKAHVKGALNLGIDKQEIIEIILQMALYVGFPAALDGLKTAKSVFNEFTDGEITYF